jgi:hypothetical protein
MVVPGLELRQFGQDPWDRGKGMGLDVFATRGEWVAARRAWEAEQGLTIAEWYWALCEDALDRCCPVLADFYAATGPYFTEDTEDEDGWDPRLAAAAAGGRD